MINLDYQQNLEDIIDKLNILVDDESKRIEMGEAGRKFIDENFNWDKIAKDFIDSVNSFKS